jgi:competence protein ComGC
VNAPAAQGRAGRWIAIVASLVVAATVVAAIAAMGTPAKQRLSRLDERRVMDLQAITVQVQAYYRQHDRVPPSLDALANEPGVRVPQAPAPGQSYGYEALGAAAYQVCAQFDTDTAQSPETQAWTPPTWAHGAGRQCFRREAGNSPE